MEEFNADLLRSIHTLEDVIGKPIRCYRAPGISVTPANPWVFEALLNNGNGVDCSVFPGKHGHGGYPGLAERPCLIDCSDGGIKAFHVSISRLMGHSLPFIGGGYFRALPYSIIRKLINEASYLMTYFHPRDFDPGQPHLRGLSPGRLARSYSGLTQAFEKFCRLLGEYEFVGLAQADRRVDWSTVPIRSVQA